MPFAIVLSSFVYSLLFYDSGDLLCDPTAFEEPILGTYLSVALDGEGRIRNIYQAGLGLRDKQVPARVLIQAIAMARKRYKVLREVVK